MYSIGQCIFMFLCHTHKSSRSCLTSFVVQDVKNPNINFIFLHINVSSPEAYSGFKPAFLFPSTECFLHKYSYFARSTKKLSPQGDGPSPWKAQGGL